METKKKKTGKSGTSSAAGKKGGTGTRSTGSTKGAGSASAKGKRTASRANRPAHKALPFIWFALALFLGACLYLNIFCNFGNTLEDPSDHWMGIVGYYVSYGIFGALGPAAFTLPLLLINLSIFWKRFVENRVATAKLLVSVLFLVSLSSIIHIFGVLMMNDGNNFPAEEIWEYGAQMLGGGIVGSTVGYLLFKLCHYVGSLIICFLLLGFSVFYVLGMTPQFLWSLYLESRKKKKKNAKPRHKRGRRMPLDDEDAGGDDDYYDGEDEDTETDEEEDEDAEENEEDPPFHSAAHGAKKNSSRERSAASRKDGAALRHEAMSDTQQTPAKKKKEEAAPIKPNLDPGTEDDVFVPAEMNRRMTEDSRNGRYADYASFKSGLQAKQKSADVSELPTERTVNAAANRDAAADRVFPAAQDARGTRKTARGDQDFNLDSIFRNEEGAQACAKRTHAPVPPEAPMKGTEAVTQNADAAPARSTHAKSASGSLGEQIEPSTEDFGLSSEEFENLEAQQETPTAAQRHRSTKKTSSAEETGTSSALADAAAAAAAQADAEKKPYVLPPLSFLHQSEPMTEENAAELRANIAALGETLKNFHVGIQGNIRYSYGPTVTRYELTPAPGVRVRTITNLSDDIALALRASGGIRIEAPIPGTNTVGIEIPNKTRSTIYLRELLESKAFKESRAPLTAALGAGIAGETLIFDIAKMPHLLIAGTTGSGKSVCINCIVLSLLYRTTPEDVRLVMIDPKKVEFSPYKNIPHLLAPIVTLPKDAAGALQASVEEMERRFEIFESVGVRDLKGYRAATADDPDMPKFPHIVIIIDELADLMMTAREEVETAICRIAQKARAAGMHLIIGTQRPSADIVTGLNKANVHSRIAFAVKSQIDSRVILDHIGAEALAGRGDMLFVPIGSMRDTRVQGAFVDDKEVEAVCDFIRSNNGLAVYDEHFIAKLKELAAQCGNRGKGGGGDMAPSDDGGDGDDDKYADAVRIAMEEKCIATSRLQRKLGIGYGRAAKLIDRMEREGIVSPPNGSKPRTILISTEEYMNRFFGDGSDDTGASE